MAGSEEQQQSGGFEVGESSNEKNQVNSQGPIGLTLKVSTSLINQIKLALYQETQQNEQQRLNLHQPCPKLKASAIPAVSLTIGSWKLKSKNEGNLAVKFYYGKKLLVWECLFGSLKKKVEIRWSQVSAINAFVDEGENGRLEIELNEPPKLWEEVNYKARKHTSWAPTTKDFTKGQVAICRRHTIICPPRVLSEPFKKLLQCDNRLVNFSQQPFPIHNSPYFHNQILDFSCNTSIQGCPTFVSSNEHQEAVVPYVPELVQPNGLYVGHSSYDLPMHSSSDIPMQGQQVLNPQNLDQIAQDMYLYQLWEQLEQSEDDWSQGKFQL